MELGPADFRMDTTVDGAVVRVAVSGEIDLTTAPLLDEGLAAAATAPAASHDGSAGGPDTGTADGPLGAAADVVLDLRGLDFIDSSGLGVLITHHKALLEAGRRLVIESPSPPTLRVLVISGLDRVLTIRPEPAG